MKKPLGPEYTLTLEMVHNLGFSHNVHGKLAEAEAMYEQALGEKEKTMGPEHTLTLYTVYNLELLYKD